MNSNLFNQGLESRDQLNQEVAALLQQYGLPAVTERLNAIVSEPAEVTEEQPPVARKRDMSKDATPWSEDYETMIRAVLLQQYFSEDWPMETEEWDYDCSKGEFLRTVMLSRIDHKAYHTRQKYSQLGPVKCRKQNLEAICVLRAFMASQVCLPGPKISTACILNRLCTLGHQSIHLCHEIFGANPDELMVGGKKRRDALSDILDRMKEFVKAGVLEPVEGKVYPYPRAHATKQKLCDAWQLVHDPEYLPF